MWNFFSNPINKYRKIVNQINDLEKEAQSLTDEQLRERSLQLREKVKSGVALDVILPNAFALVRESAWRTLKQRHFDVQLIAGIVLHEGKIAEMVTGEGKTLSATAPVYLNALSGNGVHVVTVNDYLAKRDAVWMGQVYDLLGLKVACLAHESSYLYDPKWSGKNEEADKQRDTTGGFLVQQEFLRPVSRKEAYQADIVYGTNHEFGFDYLRDNLAYNVGNQAQRDFTYAIIDEVDSILIDEARTPLIISAPDEESSHYYKNFAKVAARLEKNTDYVVDEKAKSVDIAEQGIDKVEQSLNLDDLYSSENIRLVHYLQESLKAKELFIRDKDYVVKDGEIIIVDQFTGRLMHGRRYSSGLHQAIEAKENVSVQNESKTYAQITIQNYFRMYKKLGGMTGTAQTSAEEFDEVYKLEVVTIPTNRPLIRKDLVDVVYKNTDAKYAAIIEEVKKRNALGQPILIGTVSIEKNETLSKLLGQAAIKHEVLNAKNHEREGAIIAQAGRLGAVTVATNMAGRGVDIVLGGNPFSTDEAKKACETGGLHVIGTERHEARRIDNQLRGRSGRQGDPGSSQFFLSLDDDLLRVFGGDRLKNLMQSLKIPDDQPIESRMVSRAIGQAQSKVEGLHFDSRKHLLEYDDVLNKQRQAVYKKRKELLENKSHPQLLRMLDILWMTHLEDMEALAESVRLRAYGHHDPLVEYRREGHRLYQTMLSQFDEWVKENAGKFMSQESGIRNVEIPVATHNEDSQFKDVGRNDPCPCGSGKKFKRCHGA